MTETRNYEGFIERLAEQLEAWKGTDETADAFARRVVGLMRTEQKKWERKPT